MRINAAPDTSGGICAGASAPMRRGCHMWSSIHVPHEEMTMHALIDFFTTDYGLMSAAGIAFMLGMGWFFMNYFRRHIELDEAAERARLAAAGK
jgi:Protein of unknown function (DUF3149)